MAQPHHDNPSSSGASRPAQPEPQSHQERAWAAFRKVFGENFPPGFVALFILFFIYIILQTKQQQQQGDYIPAAQFIPPPEQFPPPHTVVQHAESFTVSTVTVTTTATVSSAKTHTTASKGSSWLQLPGKNSNDNKMSSSEQTFIAVKPDGVQRGLIGPIISRFEQRGFKLVAIKLTSPSREHLEAHYADLKEKPFFPGLIDFMQKGPICAMVWEGRDVVKSGRTILGATNPLASAPGTIRGDYAIDVGRNVCHGSDSVETAKKEISLWFKEGELVSYKASQFDWIYEKS